MKNKLPKDTYSTKRFEDLHFAVCQHGTSMHKEFWDLMVDADFSKKQIFTRYMKMLRQTSQTNHLILKSVGVRHFTFKTDKD